MLEPILIVDDDPFVLGLLSRVGTARGLEVIGVRTPADASAALDAREFGVAIVDLRLGGESGLDVIKRVRARHAATETIVISADRRLSSALKSFEQEVFAFVPKPVDPAALFETVDRALERRRGSLERQRLTWELGLLNEVAEILASSLELDQAFQRALERVTAAFAAHRAILRLIPIDGGPALVRACVGRDLIELRAAYEASRGIWPTDTAIGERRPVRIDDLAQADFAAEVGRAVPSGSALVVPISAGDDVLGAICVVSEASHRFSNNDERMLLTIGRQFGVAVANGQLYERVRRAKVEWERTFDAISDPIAVFDSRARTMRTNAALARLCGWPITGTQGRTCAEVGLCGGRCPDCLVGLALHDQRSHERELSTPDGRIFAVTTLPVPGAATAAVLFAKEVTEERQQARRLRELSQEVTASNAELVSTLDRLRETQAQLVQSEKLSAIGQLVAGVAHELNNPLTSIIGYAQLVHEELEAQASLAGLESDELADDVSRILSESERAARIVRNLLTFARRQPSERTSNDVADLCGRVLSLRSYDLRLKKVDVALDCPTDLPPLFADGGQIQQALLNLVLNAEQAMKDVDTRELRITARAEPGCGTVLVEVRDTGHGIEPGNLQRVFDPFFTTRGVGEGTGLGLSIVYGIVRDHGGQIWVESDPLRRTSFFIRLPARYNDRPRSERLLVLVAHGDAVNRDFLAAVFAGWGFEVQTAPNTREAFESLAQDDVRLVVVDHALVEPDPGRWREVWRGLTRRVALVAMTSATTDDDTLRFLRESARVLVPPPFDLCQIRRAVLTALEGIV
jgi:two-component system NtrC family sensor kinase